jgi:sulfoxide reductase heme-binding subunit YedZ
VSNEFRVVQWNAAKRAYDLAIAGFVLVAIGSFVGVGLAAFPPPGELSPPVLLMRALGATAVLMLHVILAIGPLARLTPLAAPLLYNRRHLGVAFFCLVLLHAVVATGFYGGFGQGVWLVNVVTGGYAIGSTVPFEFMGFLAALVFFAMAATSHDFWLSMLGPRAWKWLHMLAYVAYALVVAHVMLGAAVDRVHPVWPIALGVGVATLTVLHLAAGFRSNREYHGDRPDDDPCGSEWADAGEAVSIPADRARVVRLPSGDSVAVFRSRDRVTAISNVCAHQGGPLGEGKIVDGCATCPWHGYQYRPEDGCSPPPYTERLPTYDVRIRAGRVQVRTAPNQLGSESEAGVLSEADHGE